ncbi:MAG: histone deacetylase [Desulfobacterales bacterium]
MTKSVETPRIKHQAASDRSNFSVGASTSMILYDDTYPSGLSEFGIHIPVSNSRTVKAFQHLAGHPVLGQCVRRWHVPRITEILSREDLLRAHAAEYIERLFGEGLEAEIVKTYELIDPSGRFYRYDPSMALFPLTDLFERILVKVAGTVQCCRIALEAGFCFYFGGGMHHAQVNYGNGFCLLNDVVISLRKLQAEGRIRKAWVIDVDAHKGDGTAAILQNDPGIATMSIHMATGWPLDGSPTLPDGSPNPSFIPSDVDIPIEAGEESDYVKRLLEGLHRLDDSFRPDVALVVSGADPYERDALPSTSSLRLTLSQMLERDLTVYRFLADRGIPYAGVMAGGYGEDAWEVYARFLEKVLLERRDRGLF